MTNDIIYNWKQIVLTLDKKFNRTSKCFAIFSQDNGY